jgi:hypothetical protein
VAAAVTAASPWLKEAHHVTHVPMVTRRVLVQRLCLLIMLLLLLLRCGSVQVAFVRQRVLQTWGKLVEESCVPLSHWNSLLGQGGCRHLAMFSSTFVLVEMLNDSMSDVYRQACTRTCLHVCGV